MHWSTCARIAVTALALGGGCRTADEPSCPRAGARSSFQRAAPCEPDIPEPTGVVTLDHALALAFARSPELAVFPYDLRAADARLRQAGLRPNPELTVEVEEFGGAGTRRSFDAAETTVQIAQPIELGGKQTRRTRVASLDKELVQWDCRSARLDVMRQVSQAFTATLAAQERLALAERLLEVSRKAQATVAQRVQAGKDSPVDQLKADVALAESRIRREEAQQALTAARHALAAAWGGHAPAFDKVTGDFYAVSAPPSLAQVQALMADNPDLARWETQEDQRRALLRLEEARAVPDVTLGGGVRRFEETDDAALVLALGVPLPLFDRNQAGVQEAVAGLAKTRRQYEAAQVRTRSALAEAVSTLTAAHETVAILQGDVLPKAQQTFDAAARGYEQGKFDYLYLLDAQRMLFLTQGQYIDSLAACHKAWADIERLTGRPQERAEQSRPSVVIQESPSREPSHEK